MKRGFLNSPKYKRAIDEARAPASPREPESGARADTTQDAIVVEMTTTKDVPVSVDGRADAMQSADPRAEAPRGSGNEKRAEAGAEASADTKDPVPNPEAKSPEEPSRVNNTLFSTSTVPIPSTRPPPRRLGRGRNPEEEPLHVVPKSTQKRAVFCFWPRNPKGRVITSEFNGKWEGSRSPDGYPWGATLYDFFLVNRHPQIHNAVATMTGSALHEGMKELGELDFATHEIEWVKSEGKPRIEGVADTAELIRSADECLILSSRPDFPKVEASRTEDREDVSEDLDDVMEESENKHDAIYIPPPPTIPTTSPFHPSHYPKPWPFTPFENRPSILLQERIPLYLLPQTMYVHDPFCLLSVREKEFRNTSWASRPDIIQTYDLRLSSTVYSQVNEARRKAEESEEFKARTLIILRYRRTKEQIEDYEPVIEVPLPPYPRRPTKIEDSHLYLSPIAKIGQGHHSIVYEGEWELPRNIFVQPKICPLCFKKSVRKEVQRLKDTGRWAKMLKVASWGPKGFTGYKPTEAEWNAAREPPVLEKDGEIIEREITCIIPPNADPSWVVEMIDENGFWDAIMANKQNNTVTLHFTRPTDKEEDPRVPIIRVNPPLSYGNKCPPHETYPSSAPVPLTAKFTVVAKLSKKGDHHLVREARNYQNFPEHFFRFYNGYTINRQLHTIVPVNAVVPQFYGYYTPRESVEEPERSGYLSPILLAEHCGEPIVPEELSLEDQNECASFLLRFQHAGWLHGSVAPRNFLVQRGRPTEFPTVRKNEKPELSFRLIDFGRSRQYKTEAEKQEEERETLCMFAGLDTMAFTLSV